MNAFSCWKTNVFFIVTMKIFDIIAYLFRSVWYVYQYNGASIKLNLVLSSRSIIFRLVSANDSEINTRLTENEMRLRTRNPRVLIRNSKNYAIETSSYFLYLCTTLYAYFTSSYYFWLQVSSFKNPLFVVLLDFMTIISAQYQILST